MAQKNCQYGRGIDYHCGSTWKPVAVIEHLGVIAGLRRLLYVRGTALPDLQQLHAEGFFASALLSRQLFPEGLRHGVNKRCASQPGEFLSDAMGLGVFNIERYEVPR